MAELVAEDSRYGDLDELLLGIYDWDYTAALSALLALDRIDKKSQLSREVEFALYVMMADKGFDPFLYVRDAWHEINETVQERIAKSVGKLPESLAELVHAVANADLSISRDISSWYLEWRGLFVGQRNQRLTRTLIGDDPVLGWTAANVLYRDDVVNAGFDAHQLMTLYTALRMSYEPQVATLRWRIAHALGRTAAAAEELLEISLDNDEVDDVRYGAMRSVLSVALKSDDPSLVSMLLFRRGDNIAVNDRVRDAGTNARKLASQLGPLRNAYGTGHGRATIPAIEDEVLETCVDGALLWTRWALRRLGPYIKTAVQPLINDLHDEIWYSGDLTERLEVVDLPTLEEEDQKRIGIAVGRRSSPNTYTVWRDGVEACVNSTDLTSWPPAYREGCCSADRSPDRRIRRHAACNESWRVGRVRRYC